jgi:hypothetical protein
VSKHSGIFGHDHRTSSQSFFYRHSPSCDICSFHWADITRRGHSEKKKHPEFFDTLLSQRVIGAGGDCIFLVVVQPSPPPTPPLLLTVVVRNCCSCYVFFTGLEQNSGIFEQNTFVPKFRNFQEIVFLQALPVLW